MCSIAFNGTHTKRLNRSRGRFRGGFKEPCIRWGSRSDESIRSREGWQDGNMACCKLLWAPITQWMNHAIANKWSLARLLTKGRIAGDGLFTGPCVTDQSEHCSRLQQSRCHAVIEDWMIPFAACRYWRVNDPFCCIRRSSLLMLFNGPDNPKNCPFSWGPEQI